MESAETEKLTPAGYLPRVIDGRLEKMLKSFGGVEITGAKWCGKTWTALAHAASFDTLVSEPTRLAALTDPMLVLEGAEPHLVDEWQEVPSIWDAARNRIDTNANRKGQIILTGSCQPKDERIHHSGTGRIARLRMRPMSLYETGDSNGTVSLKGLFDGVFNPTRNKTEVADIARWCCRGGWPSVLGMDDEFALETPVEYINSVLEVSIPKLEKTPETARRLMKALAMNVSQAVTYETLAKDMGYGEEETPHRVTVESYLEALERLFIIEDLKGWEPPLRAKTRVRTKPKRYFVDPSLAAALIGATPSNLLRDTQTLGCLFEQLCVRDLRVYLSSLGGVGNRMGYYRDEKGLEADVVIELGDGRWGAIEIKLSEDALSDEVSAKRLRLKEKISGNAAARNRPPEFLAIVVGKGDLAYRRKDGVLVVPITTLAP